MRLLDVGCGWGGMVLHAAQHHGVEAVGVTISRRQAELAEKRVVEAGLSDRVEIRLQDYRDVDDGPFDAVSSIGMFEHVGEARLAEYFRRLRALLRPGGRLLNHGISRPARSGRPACRGAASSTATCSPTASCTRSAVGLDHPGGGVRGAPPRGAARALRPDAAPLGGQPRGAWDEAVAEVGEARAGCGASTWPPRP